MQLVLVQFASTRPSQLPLLMPEQVKIAQQYHQSALWFECVPRMGEVVVFSNAQGCLVTFHVQLVRHWLLSSPQAWSAGEKPRVSILLYPGQGHQMPVYDAL